MFLVHLGLLASVHKSQVVGANFSATELPLADAKKRIVFRLPRSTTRKEPPVMDTKSETTRGRMMDCLRLFAEPFSQ